MIETYVDKIFELNYSITNTFFDDFTTIFQTKEKLTESQIKALIFISMFKNSTMTEISHRLNIEKGSFTPIAKRLIGLGYIQRVPSDEDRRVSYLVLTEKGEVLMKTFQTALHEAFEERLSTLTEDELETYFAAITFVTGVSKKINKRRQEEHK